MDFSGELWVVCGRGVSGERLFPQHLIWKSMGVPLGVVRAILIGVLIGVSRDNKIIINHGRQMHLGAL